MTLREAMNARYAVKVWQWIATWVAMTVLCFGAVIGGVVYINDQREAAAADVAQAQFLAELASYETARGEFDRCHLAVASRDNFRVALFQIGATFSGFAAAVEEVNPESPVLPRLHVEVDRFDALIAEDWPALNPADCPPEPTPPIPPR